MEKRINIQQLEPKAFHAMFGLEAYLRSSELQAAHKELLKIRASQINGCAYCIDMHTADALKQGETPRRIFALSAWRESHLFTEAERVLLQLTEDVTLIHQHGLTPDAYQKAICTFGETYTAQLIMAVATINAWNRIAIATQLVPES